MDFTSVRYLFNFVTGFALKIETGRGYIIVCTVSWTGISPLNQPEVMDLKTSYRSTFQLGVKC